MAVSTMAAKGIAALGVRQSKTWNIPHKPCPWAPLAGQAWYFSHNFRPMPTEPIESSADSSSNLDGSIKPSSIPRLEVSRNLQPPKCTPQTYVTYVNTYVCILGLDQTYVKHMFGSEWIPFRTYVLISLHMYMPQTYVLKYVLIWVPSQTYVSLSQEMYVPHLEWHSALSLVHRCLLRC